MTKFCLKQGLDEMSEQDVILKLSEQKKTFEMLSFDAEPEEMEKYLRRAELSIGVLRSQGSNLIPFTPSTCKSLIKQKFRISLTNDYCNQSGFRDSEFDQFGVKFTDKQTILSESDIIVTLQPLTEAEIESLAKCKAIVTREPF